MNTLDRTLESFGTLDAPASLTDEAQRKLEAALARRIAARPAPRLRRTGGWFAAAASAAVVVIAVLWMPLASAPAFANVQQHFRDFRTLRFEMKQFVSGQEVLDTRVAMTRNGNVRTDIGKDMSVIVNSGEGRVVTLMHEPRIAIQSPLTAPVTRENELEWLDGVRKFQGLATRLPNPRVIDGKTAYAWKLRVEDMDLTIWATDEGVPLEMQMSGPAEVSFGFHFELDAPIDAGIFSTEVPAGYAPAAEDSDDSGS
jgi:hypothetical protein